MRRFLESTFAVRGSRASGWCSCPCAFLLLLALAACAATPVRERSVVVEFEPGRLQEVTRHIEVEERNAYGRIARIGMCALPRFEEGPWIVLPESGPGGATPRTPRVPTTAEESITLDRVLDLLGVDITRVDDRSALRIETRFGDWGGLDRVVAWLEAYGGRRADGGVEGRRGPSAKDMHVVPR